MTSTMQAQYAIPSFDVELQQFNATFDENEGYQMYKKTFQTNEERKLVVEIEDPNPSVASWAVIMIQTVDGSTQMGPYTVNEGQPFEADIDNQEWEVHVLNNLEGARLSVWIQN